MVHENALQPGQYYHIFNRGNNRENLFYVERNYQYFLKLYFRYIPSIADTYAYCLLRNHFHFLVRIKSEKESIQGEPLKIDWTGKGKFNPSQNFSNLFNSYSKTINKTYNRTGSLFQDRFKRRIISSDAYFQQLVFYIHFNPQKHGFVEDFQDWKWSSYHVMGDERNTWVNKTEVLEWFGGVSGYQKFHQGKMDEKKILDFVGVDD